MKKQPQKGSRQRYLVRINIAIALVAALFTSVLDKWVVPFTDRPYAEFRAEFMRDLGIYGKEIAIRPGALSQKGSINFKGWVGR